MKVQIIIKEQQPEPEIIIQCSQLTKEIEMIQKQILETVYLNHSISFTKEHKEYYFPVTDILFFETTDRIVFAHTKDDVYQVEYRLYELEEILPDDFIRSSKSTILNINQIFSIDRHLTSDHLVQFYHSHKQVYVSRLYYKELRHKLEKRRKI